jgi:putative transposase
MSKIHRYFAPGQYCFVTTVTAYRRPLLDIHPLLLLRAVRRARRKSHFMVVAWVVMPDHVHALLHCPNGDTSRIVQRVKLSFSLQYLRIVGGSGPVWQHRYWDHIIRSEEDLQRHIDYIHINPVKHGLATSPGEWKLSSFHRFVRNEQYEPDWGQLANRDEQFGE